MNADLYDEFGTYIGPDLDSDDDSVPSNAGAPAAGGWDAADDLDAAAPVTEPMDTGTYVGAWLARGSNRRQAQEHVRALCESHKRRAWDAHFFVLFSVMIAPRQAAWARLALPSQLGRRCCFLFS